jgi:hypothetical protein
MTYICKELPEFCTAAVDLLSFTGETEWDSSIAYRNGNLQYYRGVSMKTLMHYS